MSKNSTATSIHQQVTDAIIADLERGTLPWVQPWGSPGIDAPLGMPNNARTGKAYSGINILLLWGAVIERGFGCQTWLTFRQAKALGGSVVKGSKGTTVCYADTFIPKDERQRASEQGDDPAPVPFLKRYTVFNVEQCEGLPRELYLSATPSPECETIPRAEALIAATGADFRIGGGRAFYVPSEDYIQVPPQPAFHDQINYYRTCFHEIGHWTGHESRLGRDLSARFGSKTYAREELVAEITTAFVCATLRIKPTVRHADYIGNWLDVLREDNRAIFRAASQASRAAAFILAFEQAGEAAP